MRSIEIADCVDVWPSPAESLLSSQKLETNRLLSLCAIALDFKHPLVVPVDDDELDVVLESIMGGKRDAVLKRDYTGWSRHIITPHTPLEEAKQLITNFRTEVSAYWDIPGNLFPRPTWYLQPYLPHLIHLGEVRAFFVEGIYYYSVATTPINFDPGTTVSTAGLYKRPLTAFT